MRSSATVVCQMWVKYSWNLVIAWQNVLFRRGSIKRLVTYRYRAERLFLRPTILRSYKVWSYAGQSQQDVKFLKFWNIFDLEPCKWGAPYLIWEGIDMRNCVCQMWVKYSWNLVIAWQNVLFRRGSIKRLVLQMTYRYRAEPFRNYFYRIGLPYCVVTRSDLMRVSHSRTPNWKFLKFWNIFDLHRSPVSREPLGLGAPYLLCLLYVPVPTNCVIGKALTCVVQPRLSVKCGWNIVEIL